jgi:hypothetical protein
MTTKPVLLLAPCAFNLAKTSRNAEGASPVSGTPYPCRDAPRAIAPPAATFKFPPKTLRTGDSEAHTGESR